MTAAKNSTPRAQQLRTITTCFIQTAALQSTHVLCDRLTSALERECLTCLQTSVSTHDSAMQHAAITLLKKIVLDIEESLRLSGLFSLIDIKTLLRSNDDAIHVD